jgi:uncharacterized membrane protein
MLAAGPLFVAVVVGMQVLGLCSAALARVSEKWTTQAIFQQLFLGCLLVVALMTVLAFVTGSVGWATSAATLPVMALGATIDLRRSASYSTF